MTHSERVFLSMLDPKRLTLRTRVDLPDGKEFSRIRAGCRRAGWAEFVRPKAGSAGWIITTKGSKALAGASRPDLR